MEVAIRPKVVKHIFNLLILCEESNETKCSNNVRLNKHVIKVGAPGPPLPETVSWFLGFKVSRFQRFLVCWFQSFLVSKFLGFEVSKIYQIFIPCFLEYIDSISKIFKIFSNGYSGFCRCPSFPKSSFFGSPNFGICNLSKK